MEGYIGQIIMFAGNFEPRNWAFCDGRILSISSNTALFSIIGTTYGGNGTSTFALPDLRGRVPLHAGQGGGLSNYVLGESAGTENVTLLTTEIPAHNHTFSLNGNSGAGNQTSPLGNFPAGIDDGTGNNVMLNAYNSASNGVMAGGISSTVGGSQPHRNIQPFLCVNFIICQYGIFPSRN